MTGLPEKICLFKNIRKYCHDHPLVKFIVILFFFLAYLVFSIHSFGTHNGILIALLTWSFFVFCTPIADAGIILDFPLRVLTGVRMLYLEIVVWAIALGINLFAYCTNQDIYDATLVTRIFSHILSNPFPYWIIIALSAAGTFMSIYFGDEIMDILALKKEKRDYYLKHNLKHKIIVYASILLMIIISYYFLLDQLGMDIPLI